jgi:valyl-tRNA synthetase
MEFLKKLKEKGLLISIDDNYTNRIATAERTGGMIEPQIMEQWYWEKVRQQVARTSSLSIAEPLLSTPVPSRSEMLVRK